MHIRILLTSLLLFFCGTLAALPAIALLTEGDESDRFADLAVAKYGTEFTFVEREEIERLQKEHRLQQFKPAVSPGFLKADLLAVIENGRGGKEGEIRPSRLIVFDSSNGLRLLVRPLPDDPEESLAAFGLLLREAMQKTLPGKAKLLTLAAVRNGGVGEHLEPEIRYVAADLQRRLQYLPGVIVTEREFLDRLLNEAELKGIPAKLPPNDLLLRLEFVPDGGRKEDFRTILRITEATGRLLFSREFSGASRADSGAIAETVADALRIIPSSTPPAAEEEARCFFREAMYQKYQGDPRQAVRRLYSAIALAPAVAGYRTYAIDTLSNELPERNPDESIVKILNEIKALDLSYRNYPGSRSLAASRSRDLLWRRYYEASGPERREIREWLNKNRSYLISCLCPVPAESPQTEEELEEHAVLAGERLYPFYFFDEAAYWKSCIAEWGKLALHARNFPEANLFPSIRKYIQHEFREAFERTPAVKARRLLEELETILLKSEHPDLKLLGLRAGFFRKLPLPESGADAIRMEFIDSLLKTGRRSREEYLSFLREIPNETRDISALLEQRFAQKLPATDPRSLVSATPDQLFALLQDQDVNALEMHREPWLSQLFRHFSKFPPQLLADFNPDYTIRQLGWTGGKIIAGAYEDRIGYILSRKGGHFLLSRWDASRQQLQICRTYTQTELHLQHGSYGTAAINVVDGHLLIGTADQILIRFPDGKEKILTGFSGGTVHSLTLHDRRIYAFLGAHADPFLRASANILISCDLDGGDIRTHISTRRDTPQNQFDSLTPHLVWGLGIDRKSGKPLFTTQTPMMRRNGIWQFDTETGEARELFSFSRGKIITVYANRRDNFFTQQGNELFVNVSSINKPQPVNLFLHLNLDTGETAVYGWGDEESLKTKGASRSWGKLMNFYGPFLLRGGHFWCAGGNRDLSGGIQHNVMMAHLYPDAPEKSPRLILPAARTLFPGATPASILAVYDDAAYEITCTAERE
ncbi:MAG: hypothetical protein HPZ91_09875 [Lentisphaeria bacterium]|nr:hypothetical protein [Lentisphaeria bacterium]